MKEKIRTLLVCTLFIGVASPTKILNAEEKLSAKEGRKYRLANCMDDIIAVERQLYLLTSRITYATSRAASLADNISSVGISNSFISLTNLNRGGDITLTATSSSTNVVTAVNTINEQETHINTNSNTNTENLAKSNNPFPIFVTFRNTDRYGAVLKSETSFHNDDDNSSYPTSANNDLYNKDNVNRTVTNACQNGTLCGDKAVIYRPVLNALRNAFTEHNDTMLKSLINHFERLVHTNDSDEKVVPNGEIMEQVHEPIKSVGSFDNLSVNSTSKFDDIVAIPNKDLFANSYFYTTDATAEYQTEATTKFEQIQADVMLKFLTTTLPAMATKGTTSFYVAKEAETSRAII